MSTRYQVNGHMPGWIYGARTIAILAAGGSALLLSGKERDLGILFLLCIGFAAAGVEIYAATVRRRRAWVDVLPAGVKVIDRTGERELQDYEIVALSYTNERILSNGSPAGWTRMCRLWTTLGPAIELRNMIGEGQADPLAPFIDRVGSLLKEGFEQALAEGVEVSGDGWSLTKSVLRYQVGRRRDEIPLMNITAIHATEGKLGVWVQGQELPAAHLPLDGRNAWLLSDLVAPYLKNAPASDAPPVDGLGRIIFKRRTDRIVCVLMAIVAAVVVMGSCIGFTSDEFWFIAWGGIALGVLLGAFVAHLAVADFRCQEWGVMRSSLLGKQKLLYRDIESFTYRAVRNFVNGAYTGTALTMQFTPRPGCGRTISHSSNVQGNDDELDHLRDVISHIIAAQMRLQLADGQQVGWTKNLAFTQDGLIYRPSGMLMRGKEMLLPYQNYQGYDLRDGFFYLFEKGKDRSILIESVGEANFFPGFYLLLQLAHSPAAEETVAEPV